MTGIRSMTASLSMGRRMRQDSAPHLPGCQGGSCSTPGELNRGARVTGLRLWSETEKLAGV